MAEWDEFTRLASNGSYAQAVTWMDTHNSKLVFDGCFALAVNQPAAFQGLWDSVPYAGDKISDFALDFIYGGYMPQKSYALMDWGDYDNAREVYLRAYEKTKRPARWAASRHDHASSVCLYPEYGFWRTRRATIVQLAIDHSEIGPGNRWQANLFCLGGRYTYGIGKQGSQPSGPGTTCMLVARSIMHAAGINVIGPATPKSCSCDLGLNAEIAHLKCYVGTKTSTALPTPNPGDIFHIEGKPFKGGIGSAHVGVIISVAGNKWRCVQGGASDHVTRTVTYTVKRASDPTWGTWCFEEDFAGVKMIRGIRGYWNIDLIGSGNMMTGGVPQMGMF